METYKSLLSDNDIAVPAWLNKAKVRGHVKELDQMLREVSHRVTLPIFHLLFSDRVFLFQFQKLVQQVICDLRKKDHPDLLDNDGVLKRTYVPQWLRDGVYHRDQGRCQKCYSDLSGLVSSFTDRNFDHIIPLAVSGSNDPTNYQLLCEDCNKSKGKKEILTPRSLVPYWDME